MSEKPRCIAMVFAPELSSHRPCADEATLEVTSVDGETRFLICEAHSTHYRRDDYYIVRPI